jgi:class 3 adenylate cyclase
MEPDVRYAKSSGVAIAYQVVGDGDTDLVYVPDYVSNLVYGWEWPRWRNFYLRIAESFRLILFDKRGTGLSDTGGTFATLETRMEDLHAVLDAVGSTRTVLFGSHEGCNMATLFAAVYPERTRALVVFQPAAEPIGEEFEEADLLRLRDEWGTNEFANDLFDSNFPSLLDSETDRRWFSNWLRLGASPAVAYAINNSFHFTELRDVVSAVRVPTLVLYRDGLIAEYALQFASLLPSATVSRVAGRDLSGIFLNPEVVDEIASFVAGEEAPVVPESTLVALLFTDLVASTEHAAELGDRGWRDLLSRHHELVRRELARFRGEERDTAGDGFFATFDGPARAMLCARTIVDNVRELGLEVRAGVHVGECEIHDGKVAGIAVSVGARVATAASAGEVLVSSTAKDLVAGSGIQFADRGAHELKGVPGEWRLYAVLPA